MTDESKKMREALEETRRVLLDKHAKDSYRCGWAFQPLLIQIDEALSSPPVVCNSCNGSGSPMTCTCQPVVEGKNEEIAKACCAGDVHQNIVEALDAKDDLMTMAVARLEEAIRAKDAEKASLQSKLSLAVGALEKIVSKPNETLSNGKAMRRMLDVAQETLAKVKEK